MPPLAMFIVEQLLQLKYGVGGAALAVCLISGLKAKSEICQCVAVIAFLLLLF